VRSDVVVLSALASVVLAVHFLLGNGYGWHRDELQFLDDARHLQWGFVAYPPLTAFCGRVAIALFGISPQVFRLPAAMVDTLSLVLVGLMARDLGGRRMAQVVALLAMLPLGLALSSLMQYTSFDLLGWTLMAFFTARVLSTGDERNWLGVGLGLGVGANSKYSIALLLVSVLVGLLALPSRRKHLRSRWFWYGALVATLMAAPNLIWLARHQFITLQMETFIHARDVRHGRADGYYSDQLLFTLLGFPLAVAGLVSLLRSARFRLLSLFYVGPFVIFAALKGRGYYLIPAYPALYAAGAVALERALNGRTHWLRLATWSVVTLAMLADTVAINLRMQPVYHPGSARWQNQLANNGDLRDEIGWPELVAQVAAVRDALTPEERANLGVLANNYGEAGAIALFGPQHGLPYPISSTNTFHMRGYGTLNSTWSSTGPGPETLIVLGDTLENQLKNFETCRVAAQVVIPYGVRNEEAVDHPVILVCHHLKLPWAVVWARSQEFG